MFKYPEIQKSFNAISILFLRVLLKQGSSVNLYMFYGGNNYGFTSGANISKPFITSYGNSAPIDVTGAVSEKYFAIRNVIKEFFPLPNVSIPPKPRKMQLPPVKMQPITSLFSSLSRRILGGKAITSRKPCTFEQLHQNVGYVLYEKTLPKSATTLSTLSIPEFRDRAYIYVNNVIELKVTTQLTTLFQTTNFNCRN